MNRALREMMVRAATTVVRPFCGGLGCILALQRVIPNKARSALPSNRALEITPEDLRAMLAWTRERGLEAIRLDEVPDRLAGSRGPRFVCFTLDDGYRDNLVHALPVFREFSAPLTVNVTNGFAAGTASVWWYFVEEALAAQETLRFSWEGKERRFPAQTTLERNRALDEIAGLIRALGMGRDELIRCVAEAAGVDPCAATRRLCMGWEEVRTLAADPLVTIGAHTAGHHGLNRLTEAEIVAEVEGGRRELAAQIGREVRHFAYPFGGPNAAGEREFAIVRRSGFATMLTTRAGNLTGRHAGLADRLPRFGLSGNYPAVRSLSMIESGLAALRERKTRRG